MFSIQSWFAKDDEFLELLKKSAQSGRASIQSLKSILQSPHSKQLLETFATNRREDKMIKTRITELLARTSITTLEPEDIEALSIALYKISKTAEKFAERYFACATQVRNIDFSRQVILAEQSTEMVEVMINALEKSKFDEVTVSNQKLQTIEGDGDKLMLQLLTELYSGNLPPMTVIIVKDLYELLEKVMDRCRDVGNVVGNVALKHS